MRCSACTGSTHVLDTRAGADTIRRRRECTVCGERFTTYERADLAADELERTVIAYVRGLDPAPTTQEATR